MTSDSILHLIILHLWQVSLLLVVVTVVSKRIERRWPHLAFILWCVFFVKCLIPPMFESPAGIMAWTTPSCLLGDFVSGGEAIHHSASSLASNQPLSPTDHLEGVAQAKSVPLQLSSIILFIWSIGFILCGAFALKRYFRVINFVQIESQQKELQSISRECQSELARLVHRLGWSCESVSLVISKKFQQPFAFGFFKPTIVIPETYATHPEIIQTALSHELCHLWRRDPLLGWLQLSALGIFWFHPGIWYACRRFNFLCEVCCDDDTVRIFSIPTTTYAHGLVQALARPQSLAEQNLAPPLTPGLSAYLATRRRIESVLRRPHSGLFRATYQLSAFLLFLLIVPAIQSSDGRIGFASRPQQANIDVPSSPTSSSPTSIVGGPSNMDFLVGRWTVYQVDENGNETPAGHSHFAIERSGRMIRENWTAENGATAQGISFFDQAKQHWRMTWVDSNGTVSETHGNWQRQQLELAGQLTASSGQQIDIQTQLTRCHDNEFHSLTTYQLDDSTEKNSKVIYRR